MIPLSVPFLDGNEWKYVKNCLDTGWISSSGDYVNKFEQKIAEYVGSKYAVACMNGTSALHISQLVLGINNSDYVIVPNITFVATLNSIKYCGASPILIDAKKDTWQMDLDLLESFLEKETELRKVNDRYYSFKKSDGKRIMAIIPVHVLGNMTDMNRLIRISKKYHLSIIEDSAESLGSFYKKKHSGTFGSIGVFSFNGNKIISTGGGGVIVTDDMNIYLNAKHIANTAKIDKLFYIHDKIGYNYRMVNILAAIGLAQIEILPKILRKKKEIDLYYRKSLKNVGDIIFQKRLNSIDSNCWLFTFKTSKMKFLLKFLNENGVQSRPFWMPMNQLDMFKNDLFISKNDNSAELYKSCISIPCSAGITRSELNLVVNKIKEFYKNN